MKRITLVLISLLMAVFTYGQTKHLTVLGIPITGNIASFQQKLVAKNYRVDTKRNKELPVVKGSLKDDSQGMNAL